MDEQESVFEVQQLSASLKEDWMPPVCSNFGQNPTPICRRGVLRRSSFHAGQWSKTLFKACWEIHCGSWNQLVAHPSWISRPQSHWEPLARAKRVHPTGSEVQDEGRTCQWDFAVLGHCRFDEMSKVHSAPRQSHPKGHWIEWGCNWILVLLSCPYAIVFMYMHSSTCR